MATAITTMGPKKYNQYLAEGYIEHSSTKISHQASVGQYVVLRQPISTCEMIARSVGCVVIAPIACLTFLCCYNQVFDCMQCCIEGQDGFHQEKGYVKDEKATTELRCKDYLVVGIDRENIKPTLKAYVLAQMEQGLLPITCADFPQHSYMTFYGATSNFSYIILIPNGNYDDMDLYPVFNEEGKPCNTQEIKKKATNLCAGWRKGVKKIITTARNIPVAQTITNTGYGSAQSTTYLKGTEIKSYG